MDAVVGHMDGVDDETDGWYLEVKSANVKPGIGGGNNMQDYVDLRFYQPQNPTDFTSYRSYKRAPP